MKTYDLIVIGSGSGLEVSAEAAERGLSVAVVESGPFGGTCLNRGCIPSKILIHCADVMETIQQSELFGIKAKVEAVDWQYIIRRASDEVDEESRMVEEGNRQAPNIDVYKETARFVGDKTLQVEGDQITAETILIAAGTRPWAPEIPHFYGTLGTEVTIIHRRPTLLREEDEQVAQRFTEVYQRKFNLLLNAQVDRAYREGAETVLDVTVDGRTQQVRSDALLMATGRVPNTDLLEVDKTGVEVDQRGFIKVDEYLETNVPGIWTLGDIVGRYLLKHSANLEAAYVANIFNPDSKVAVDYHAMPHAVFASPQVASVELTEQAAKEQGVPYTTALYDYYDTAYGSSIEDRDGFAKVLADHHSDEIRGCHIIGSHASMLIQDVVNAMRMRLTTDAITQSIYVHPALPEVVQRAFGSLPR